MKRFFLGCMSLIALVCCNANSNEQERKLATITSIEHEYKDIRGNYYGKKYVFVINVDNTDDIDILSFCRVNFSNIFNSRVNETEITAAILKELNENDSERVNIDEKPYGLRLITYTDYDGYPMTVSAEIYVIDGKRLTMKLKYDFPL